MITADLLIQNKNDLDAISQNLSETDISQLVDFLSEKNDTVRYSAFQLLQKQSNMNNSVYKHWQTLAEKIDDGNSYQRSIGIMLIAENVRWDSEGKFEDIAEKYLAHCCDEKFITSRQTIQSIAKWLEYKKELIQKTVDVLIGIDILSFKETQRKLILTDIIDILMIIRQIQPYDAIESYITNALTGGLLDKKTISAIQKRL